MVKEHGISMGMAARRLYEEGEISEQTLNYFEKLDQTRGFEE